MTLKNKYARVVVGVPIDNIFDYIIPDSLKEILRIGMRVLVPFGRRRVVGCVVGLTDKAEVSNVKEIRDVLDEEPTLSENLLRLTRWMADYYFSSWGMVVRTALPSSLNRVEPKTLKRKRPVTGDQFVDNSSQIINQKSSILTNVQRNAMMKIKEGLDTGGYRTILLHCPVGNGKIDVYMESISHLREKGAIVLVPEISITPQLLMNFCSRFGKRVAVLHSGLTESERLREWMRIHKGEADIVIGVRSAVFGPLKKVGLIIIDEEHDTSYKQDDGLRYNTRDVAIMRGKIEGATVILGSPTPSLESFYNAKKGKYLYLSLHEKDDQRHPPTISLVDVSKEKKRVISEQLSQGISERLKRGERVLLFLNRRGYSPFLLCRECGYSPRCPNCSITLTYHKVTHKGKDTIGPVLKCHYCNNSMSPPETCPDCGGTNIGYIGAGTERVEEEIKRLYPDANLARIDRDTIGRKGKHLEGLKDINQNVNIILGTQIVSKGSLFLNHPEVDSGQDVSGPPVTLAGIIWADRGLHIPDFRSAERTFQLISQLAGRVGTRNPKIVDPELDSGQGSGPCEIIIQTHNPDHYCLRHIRENDYPGFYVDEMRFRKELGYPPFFRLIRIIFKGKREEDLVKIMPDLRRIIRGLANSNIEFLGPAQASLYKLKGMFRWHIIIKGKDIKSLHDYTSRLLNSMKEKKLTGIKIEVDVDPARMM